MSDAFGIQPVADVPRKPAFPPGHVVANVPSAEQLDLPYQRVKLRNTDQIHTHIMLDRFMQGHVLQPGQSCEIEMTVPDISSLLNLAKTDRGFYTAGPNIGKPFPPHPVRIEGLTPERTDGKKEPPQGAPVVAQPVVRDMTEMSPQPRAEPPQPMIDRRPQPPQGNQGRR